MRSWPPIDHLQRVPLDSVGELRPSEVLYEFDGPCIFTAEASSGIEVLAYLSEDLEEDEALRYLVSTTSTQTIHQLKSGAIAVHEAMLRGSLWCVDFNYNYEPVRAFSIQPNQLPDDALPQVDTMLWPSLEPALTIRLEGDDIRTANIPAAAFVHAAEVAAKAFKPVFEWAASHFRQDTNGRPPEWLRDLYALSTQRLTFGSVEVAFAQPPCEKETQLTLALDDGTTTSLQEITTAAWSAVREGLDWAVSDPSDTIPPHPDAKWTAILESMQRLAPASAGPVSSVEVWGPSIDVDNRRVRLDRNASKRIRKTLTALKKKHEVQLGVFKGRVRELDLDRLTFVLRDVEGGLDEVSLSLEDERLLETVHDAHYYDAKVMVTARSENKKIWTARDVEFVVSDAPEEEPHSVDYAPS